MSAMSLSPAYKINEAHPWLPFNECLMMCKWEEARLFDEELTKYHNEHGDDPGWKWRGRVARPKVIGVMETWAKEPAEQIQQRYNKAKSEALELAASQGFWYDRGTRKGFL